MPEVENGWRGRMEEGISDIKRRLDSIEEHPGMCPQIKLLEDHERRVRVIERTMYLGMGGLAVLNMIGIWRLFTISGMVGK